MSFLETFETKKHKNKKKGGAAGRFLPHVPTELKFLKS